MSSFTRHKFQHFFGSGLWSFSEKLQENCCLNRCLINCIGFVRNLSESKCSCCTVQTSDDESQRHFGWLAARLDLNILVGYPDRFELVCYEHFSWLGSTFKLFFYKHFSWLKMFWFQIIFYKHFRWLRLLWFSIIFL